MPTAVALANLQPITRENASEMGRRGGQIAKAKALKLAQLEELTASLSIATGATLVHAASLVDRRLGLKCLRAQIRKVSDKVDDILACPFPGYARDLRDLSATLESFRRQERMLLEQVTRTSKRKPHASTRTPERQRPEPRPAPKESILTQAPPPPAPPPPA